MTCFLCALIPLPFDSSEIGVLVPMLACLISGENIKTYLVGPDADGREFLIQTTPSLPSEGVPTTPSLPGEGVPTTPSLPGEGVQTTPSLQSEGVPTTPSLPGEGVQTTPSLPSDGEDRSGVQHGAGPQHRGGHNVSKAGPVSKLYPLDGKQE